MKRFVSIGSTTDHNYSFFLPIIGSLWRRVGYIPNFYLIGRKEDWEDGHASHVHAALSIQDFDYQFVDPVPGVEDATVAQSIRLYAAADDTFHDKDLLIPSDADILPLRKDFYCQHNLEEYPIASYYSNGYPGEEGKHFPTCHVSAQVGVWREFMHLNGDGSRECMIKSFNDRNLLEKIKRKAENPKEGWVDVWFEDEYSISEKIIKSQYYPDRVQYIRRDGHPPKDRLDRAHPHHWDNIPPNFYTDAHSIRPGWSDKNYPKLRALLRYVIPGALDWIDPYRELFRKEMGVPG
jgi:hypothetical protein